MTSLTLEKTSKTDKVIFWVFTSVFVLFDGVGAIAFNTQPAIEGIAHLGFPDFFRIELGIGKIIGGVLLIVPQVPHRLKEWAYVGFGISTISAIIGHLAVDSSLEHIYLPIGVLAVLLMSYIYYHKTRVS
ncbi:MAG: DoxX family protein [Imperialibacter sp.]